MGLSLVSSLIPGQNKALVESIFFSLAEAQLAFTWVYWDIRYALNKKPCGILIVC